MKKAQDDADISQMMVAARLNWRLWTIFQADLLDPDSPVPLDIRNNMLSLAAYVDKTTVTFLTEQNPRLLDAMISINRELSAGLTEAPEEPPSSEAPTPPQDAV